MIIERVPLRGGHCAFEHNAEGVATYLAIPRGRSFEAKVITLHEYAHASICTTGRYRRFTGWYRGPYREFHIAFDESLAWAIALSWINADHQQEAQVIAANRLFKSYHIDPRQFARVERLIQRRTT